MIALLIYLLSGLGLSWLLFADRRIAVRIWLGLVFGCVFLMWLPCLFAFAFDFTLTAQYCALSLAGLIALSALYLLLRKRPTLAKSSNEAARRDCLGFALSLALTGFCAYLLHTHVLRPEADGSLWVGQATYGDLAMHLGFVESLFRQGKFPPEYSIFPGQQLNYPFLVDAASASLRFFGLSLRAAVILPNLVMLLCVFWGFWLLADEITDKLLPDLLSWLLFVFNGGFGFALFLGKYPFSDIFIGYYTTPTNFYNEDIRWVNVICDMLIPQRTTMAGWCVLLAAVYLLILAVRRSLQGSGRREILILAVLASCMPMIHTHSFLALGILSAVWFFCALPQAKKSGTAGVLFLNYVFYGLICLLLAAPQILYWTMDSVSTGNLLQWNLGWVVGANGAVNNWFLFYTVNCGLVFLAMWPMLFFLRGEKRSIFLGAAAIFVLSNLVAFQPNLYDNNKLLYVWFMLTDILVCDWLCQAFSGIRLGWLRRALALFLVLLGTFSGLLSIARETVSNYRLLSGEQAAAADFITEHTEPDALFLTATNHTNAVSVLTGRSIVCGPGLYLYFHGVNYQAREQQVARMYQGGEAFLRPAEELGVDYVYIGDYERASYSIDEAWFSEHYPLIYDQGGIHIYRVNGNGTD